MSPHMLGHLRAFLAEPGPSVVRAPEHLERYEQATAPFDVETQYALLAFPKPGVGRDDAALARLELMLPKPTKATPYP